MTPEQEELLNELVIRLNQLLRSDTIPHEIEVALAERLGIMKFVGTGSAGATTSISAFPFNLPANPSGTVAVNIGGTIYNLLYK